MPAETPGQILELWLAAFRSNDLPALVSLYDRECAFVEIPIQRPFALVKVAGMIGVFVRVTVVLVGMESEQAVF